MAAASGAQSTLPLARGITATFRDAEYTEQGVSRSPVQEVFLGYPHGPKTSGYVPKDTLAITRVGALTPYPKQRAALTLPLADGMPCLVESTFPISVIGQPQIPADSIYYRKADLLVKVVGGTLRRSDRGFTVESSGPLLVTAMPDYVRYHLGYSLWDKRPVYDKPIAGWCSWMAHLQSVTEEDVLRASEFLATNLRDYGYNIVQIDDGYQRSMQDGEKPLGPGERYSEWWTKPNEKFPSGLPSLAQKIKAKGLVPGIWVGLYTPLGLRNQKDYILDKEEKPLRGPWVNWAMNGLAPGAEEAYFETFRTLKRQGWDYFKVDTLRHVLYDNYRLNPEYWSARKQKMETAYRRIMTEIKGIAGSSYVLACWGTIPELAGIPDGCRIGEDVQPRVESMQKAAKYIAQFHHLNNVVWRNDPDYMCIRGDIELARSWSTLLALSGGHIMVSDKPESYSPDHVKVLRQIGPPLISRPANVAPLPPDPEFLALHCQKGSEQWTVLGHLAYGQLFASSASVETWGLDPARTYLAWDFWQTKFLGLVKGTLDWRGLAPGQCQVISLRPLQDHPQVLGTDRHIGQGVHELERVLWTKNRLSGRFLRAPGSDWRVFVHVPNGFVPVGATGAELTMESDSVARLRFSEGNSWQSWSVTFSHN